ncbi:MAG TPA: fused MFS/spermidine synthase [Thermoanaerobaculia bacterium]|nr:fused MFS/spermidine synthase [Thermoanaerobaculia bacterium]
MRRPSGTTIAQSAVILISVFVAGASLMAMEILAFRVIGKNFGTALRETSIVISVFLLAMSGGYWGGGRVGDRYPVVRTLALALILAGLSTLPVPLLDPVISDRVYASGLPLPLHSFLVTVVLFGIPTILLAAVSPIAIRLLAPSREESGSTAGIISALSTAGSVTGSLLAAFALIGWFGGVANSMTAIAIAIMTCAVATAGVAASHRGEDATRPRARWAFLVIGLLAAAAGAFAMLAYRPGALPNPNDPAGRQRTVHKRETPYHSIRVVDLDGRHRWLSFGRFHQSAMDLRDPFGPGFRYTDFFHVPMILDPERRNVLFIGLGGGTGPKQFLRHYPNVQIAAVEIDPGVVEVAREFFALPRDRRLTVDVGDGRMWLQRTTTRFDAVIIDAFTVNRYGISLPWQFTTREFFREVEAKTTQDAVIIFNSPGTPESPISQALLRTIATTFPYQLVFASGGNTVIAASREEIGTTRQALAERAARLRAEGKIHLRGLEKSASKLVDTPPRAADAVLLTDDAAPVDDLLRRSW